MTSPNADSLLKMEEFVSSTLTNISTFRSLDINFPSEAVLVASFILLLAVDVELKLRRAAVRLHRKCCLLCHGLPFGRWNLQKPTRNPAR